MNSLYICILGGERPPIEEPIGISQVDAPIMILLAVVVIVAYIALSRRKVIDKPSSAVGQNENAVPFDFNENDVLMQPKDGVVNSESLPFSGYSSTTRYIWKGAIAIVVLTVILTLIFN